MKAIIRFCALAFSVGALAQATTVNTTVTVTATGTVSLTAVTATGIATMPGVFSGTGTFSGSLPLNVNASGSINGTFTITPSTGGTLTGTLTLQSALLEQLLTSPASSGTGSAAITGGTGSYVGYTGTFPLVNGTGAAGANGGFSITLTGAGTVTIGGSSTPTPTITAVLDAAGNTANLAAGSIFIVKGTNLSSAGYFPLSLPYPSSSSGVQIAFTPVSGGTPSNAYLVYLYNQNGVNQLAAILPSALAPGSYNATVTNSGTVSAPFAVTVVAHKPALFTQDSSGTGLVVVQNYISANELDVNRFTTGSVSGVTISPAKAGQTLIAWATGIGPITTPDNTSTTLNFLPGLNVQVIVGGVSITPSFAGLSGYPGEDQINFVLPSNVPTGCTVSFQVSVNGVLSNPTYLAIAGNASATACTVPGLTTAQLQSLDQGGTVTEGSFDLSQFAISATVPGLGTITEKTDSAGGSFTQFTGFQLASLVALTGQAGTCQVLSLGAQNALSFSGGTNLDAGAIALTGPSGSNITNQPLTETSNAYNLNIGIETSGITLPPGITFPGLTNASIVPGLYTLRGSGGKDVGPFTASINLGSPLTITGGLPSAVTRSAGLTLHWTGGNATDQVDIVGSAGAANNTSTFICVTTAGPGTFTVPASILQQLPASGTATGFLEVLSGTTPASGAGLFTAPLTAGGSISNATFLTLLGFGVSASYQ